MRIALKESGSLGFSKKLKMSRIGCVLFPNCRNETLGLSKLWLSAVSYQRSADLVQLTADG
jgi:hypothetical protein